MTTGIILLVASVVRLFGLNLVAAR